MLRTRRRCCVSLVVADMECGEGVARAYLGLYDDVVNRSIVMCSSCFRQVECRVSGRWSVRVSYCVSQVLVMSRLSQIDRETFGEVCRLVAIEYSFEQLFPLEFVLRLRPITSTAQTITIRT